MSKSAAAIAPICRLHIGGFCGVLATLVLLPSAVLAANPDPILRRSDQIDVRRLGKVSEDERSVLRTEWNAGLAGVEEKRSVEDMLDRLRRLETGIKDISHLLRNMPAQAPAVAAAAPVAAAVPAAAEAPGTDGYDLRLVVANLAALALVALWWYRRRKSAAQPVTGPTPSPEDALPAVALHTETPVTALAAPKAAAFSGAEAIATPETEAQFRRKAEATPEAAAKAATRPAAEAPRNVPDGVVEPPDPAPFETAGPAATTIAGPPETGPAKPFAADTTMVIDFSLDGADPEHVTRENAKLQALRPVDPPEPPPPPTAPQKTDVEPTLQLAEIMLSMGLEQVAAQTLIEYIEANPRHAVYHWLKLLGIYRSRGLKKEFAETAEKLRSHFNIQAEEWSKPADQNALLLENFSRVAEHVEKLWSQPGECIAYLQHLLEDNRDGARAGFPQSVAEEILLLIEVQKDVSGANQPAA